MKLWLESAVIGFTFSILCAYVWFFIDGLICVIKNLVSVVDEREEYIISLRKLMDLQDDLIKKMDFLSNTNKVDLR